MLAEEGDLVRLRRQCGVVLVVGAHRAHRMYGSVVAEGCVDVCVIFAAFHLVEREAERNEFVQHPVDVADRGVTVRRQEGCHHCVGRKVCCAHSAREGQVGLVTAAAKNLGHDKHHLVAHVEVDHNLFEVLVPWVGVQTGNERHACVGVKQLLHRSAHTVVRCVRLKTARHLHRAVDARHGRGNARRHRATVRILTAKNVRLCPLKLLVDGAHELRADLVGGDHAGKSGVCSLHRQLCGRRARIDPRDVNNGAEAQRKVAEGRAEEQVALRCVHNPRLDKVLDGGVVCRVDQRKRERRMRVLVRVVLCCKLGVKICLQVVDQREHANVDKGSGGVDNIDGCHQNRNEHKKSAKS
eukprot:PhM_4_TR13345/c1_g1_i1/m.69180